VRDDFVRDEDRLRRDSLTRPARLVEDERLRSTARERDSDRAGALPLTVRPRSEPRVARSEPRPLERVSDLPRVTARVSLRWRRRLSVARSTRDSVAEARLRDSTRRSKSVLERRWAAHSRLSERATARAEERSTRAEAGRALSTNRVCATWPR
jgi:hypothetical protein